MELSTGFWLGREKGVGGGGGGGMCQGGVPARQEHKHLAMNSLSESWTIVETCVQELRPLIQQVPVVSSLGQERLQCILLLHRLSVLACLRAGSSHR